MKSYYTLILLLTLIDNPVESILLSKCEIARRLLQIDESIDVINWVCLTLSASGGNTSLVLGEGFNSFWGLFQIKGGEWCSLDGLDGHSICNENCTDLLNDDLIASVNCAKKVLAFSGGFHSWQDWLDNCFNSKIPDLEECDLYHDTNNNQIEAEDDIIEEEVGGGGGEYEEEDYEEEEEIDDDEYE